jgi:single-strand DNA-binding protein
MQMLGGKPVGGGGDGGESYSRSKSSDQSAPAASNAASLGAMDDDIPF